MVCLQNKMFSMDESMEFGNCKNNSQCFLLDLREVFSAGNGVLDVWAIGFSDPSSILCNMQAPILYELALVTMILKSELLCNE